MLIDVELPGLTAEVLVANDDGEIYLSIIKKAMISIDHRDFDFTAEAHEREDLWNLIEAKAVKMAEAQNALNNRGAV